MSAEATGWVWKYSPYTGAPLLVHLAIADVVNDTHDNEFWMSGAKLAAKAKVSRHTVTDTLTDMQARGLMEMLESGAEHRRPSRFRFLMPTSAVSALAPPVDIRTASAPTAHGTRDQRATTSAISTDSHARPPRANPKEITQEPKADCIRCRGEGRLWSSGTGTYLPCPCTDTRPLVAVQS